MEVSISWAGYLWTAVHCRTWYGSESSSSPNKGSDPATSQGSCASATAVSARYLVAITRRARSSPASLEAPSPRWQHQPWSKPSPSSSGTIRPCLRGRSRKSSYWRAFVTPKRYCSVATPCMVIFKCNFEKTSKDFSLFYKQFPIGLLKLNSSTLYFP